MLCTAAVTVAWSGAPFRPGVVAAPASAWPSLRRRAHIRDVLLGRIRRGNLWYLLAGTARSRLVGSLGLGLLAKISGTGRWHGRVADAASNSTPPSPANCPFGASCETIESASEGKPGHSCARAAPVSQRLDLPRPADPLIVYAGRFIPEKQVPAIVAALAQARETLPILRACLFGEGPHADAIRDAIKTAGLDALIELPGS